MIGWELGVLPLLTWGHERVFVVVARLSYHAEPRSGRYRGTERCGEAGFHVW